MDLKPSHGMVDEGASAPIETTAFDPEDPNTDMGPTETTQFDPEEDAAQIESLSQNMMPSHSTVPVMKASHEIETYENVFNVDETQTFDNPILIAPPETTDESQRKANALSAALRASGAAKDWLKAYNDSYIDMTDSQFHMEDANISSSEAVANLMKSTVGYVSEDEIAAAANQIIARSQEPGLGPYKAVVDSLPQSVFLSPKEKDEAAYYWWLTKTQAKVWDEMNISDIASDVFKQMIVPDNNIRMTDVAKYLGLETSGADLFNTTELQKRMSTHLSTIPVEARATLVQGIVDNWETFGAFGNKLEAMEFLSHLTSFTEGDQKSSMFWNMMDRADQAGQASIVGSMLTKGAKVFTGMFKAGTIIRQAARLSDTEAVRVAAKAGAQGMLKEVGVSPLDGANTMVPVESFTKLAQGAPKGFAPEILEMDKTLKNVLEDIQTTGLPLSEEDRARAISKAMAKAQLEPEVTDVSVLKGDRDGFVLNVKIGDNNEVREIPYKLNDIGNWTESQTEMGFFSTLVSRVISPHERFWRIQDEIVNMPDFALKQGKRIVAAFEDAAKTSFGKLSDTEWKKVNSLLLQGDNEGRIFTYADAVTNGINGVQYSEKEFKAYVSGRMLFDNLHTLKNKQMRTEMIARNVKSLEIEGESTIGKVYDDLEQARPGYMGSKYSQAYMKDGKIYQTPLTNDELAEHYLQGYKLVRAQGNDLFSDSAKKNVEWALVKRDFISELPPVVLEKRTGYVTKLREGSNFFLKRKSDVEVVGASNKIERLTTEAYSSTRTELEDYLAKLDPKDREKYVILGDREIGAVDREVDQLRTMGGLFSGSRKQGILPYIGKDIEGQRSTVIASLQRYIANVANNMPISVYREGLKQKWLQTALENGVISHSDLYKDFNLIKLDPKHPKFAFFDQSHKEISFMTGIKTADEVFLDKQLSAIAYQAEKVPYVGKKVASLIYEGKTNPASIMKSLAYDLMLGTWNVSQMFVQSSGAIIPMSMNPIHGANGFKHALDFMMMDRAAKTGLDMSKLGKNWSGKAWELWNKSGMRESVTNSNLDYATMFNEMPYNAGVLRRALGNSDIFVKMGEMGYSRVAFGTAYEFVKKELGRELTEADLPAIVKRAELYRLNMSKSNTAGFQRGLMSVPTQFLQVQTKFLEKLFGHSVSHTERINILGAQMTLFGAQGMPFFGTLNEQIMGSAGLDLTNYTPEQVSLMKRGLIGYALHDVLNVNMNLGNRISLGNDIGERVLKLCFGNANAVELASGPIGSVIGKGLDIWERFRNVNTLMLSADALEPKHHLAAAKVLAEEFAKLPSSGAHLIKGITMMNSGLYKNAMGQHIFEYRDPSLRNALAEVIGFSNTEAEDWYALQGTTNPFEDKKVQRTYAKMMASTVARMIDAGADEQWVYATAYNAMRTAFAGKQGSKEIIDQVEKELKDKGKPWNMVFQKALDTFQNECLQGMDLWSRNMIRTNPTLGKEAEAAGVNLREKK